MDKLKVYLAVLKKHYFWVLSGLLVFVSLGIWYSATSSAAAQFKRDKMVVDAAFSSVGSQLSGEPLANASFKTGVDNLHNVLKSTKVGVTWQQLYDQQKTIFKWPFLKDAIVAQDLGTLSQTDPIPDQTRDAYAAIFSPPYQQWHDMFDSAQIQRPVAGEVLGLNSTAPREPSQRVEMQGLIYWDRLERNALVDRYDPKGRMIEITNTWVRVTQEDMWVFKSLLSILASLNQGVQDPTAAHIKRVEYLDLAQWAMNDVRGDKAGKVKLFKAKVNPDAMLDPSATQADPLGSDPGAEPAGKPSNSDESLLHGRYLDDKMQPLPFNAPHPFSEFKQLYVRMVVVMDQRWVGDLLAACANAELPVDVRQVLMNMQPPKAIVRRDTPQANQTNPEPPPYDCTIDLRGVVYLYNDPKLFKLGTGGSAAPAKRSFGIPSGIVVLPRKGGTSKGPEAVLER